MSNEKSTLEERVKQLEQRVAALENAQTHTTHPQDDSTASEDPDVVCVFHVRNTTVDGQKIPEIRYRLLRDGGLYEEMAGPPAYLVLEKAFDPITVTCRCCRDYLKWLHPDATPQHF